MKLWAWSLILAGAFDIGVFFWGLWSQDLGFLQALTLPVGVFAVSQGAIELERSQ